jgi:hypothetical protein
MVNQSMGGQVMKIVLGIGSLCLLVPIINWAIELFTGGEYYFEYAGINMSEAGLPVFIVGIVIMGIWAALTFLVFKKTNK